MVSISVSGDDILIGGAGNDTLGWLKTATIPD